MKTVLSCCTAKLFAQALLPIATMGPPLKLPLRTTTRLALSQGVRGQDLRIA